MDALSHNICDSACMTVSDDFIDVNLTNWPQCDKQSTLRATLRQYIDANGRCKDHRVPVLEATVYNVYLTLARNTAFMHSETLFTHTVIDKIAQFLAEDALRIEKHFSHDEYRKACNHILMNANIITKSIST